MNKFKLSITFFLLCLLFFTSGEGRAAPTIQHLEFEGDQASDGSVVRISGVDFGSSIPNYSWIGGSNGPVEMTPEGETPANANNWIFDQGAGFNMITSNVNPHSGNKSLYYVYSSNAYNGAVRYESPNPIGPDQTIFVSWWCKRQHDGDGQWKMFRINYRNDITDDYPQMVMFNWYNSSQFFVRPGPSISSNVTADWSPPYPKQDDRWYRMDLLIHTSSVGANNGSYSITLHDPSNSITTKVVSNAMSYYDSSRWYQWFIWQNYVGNGISAQETWIDDMYVQVGTQARVELGDNITFSKCTWREIQPPLSWADNQIDIRLNKGSFQEGDTAYLFIVDAEGNVSDGYPITIGGSGIGGEPTDNPPSVTITNPTSNSTYSTSDATITIAGNALDDNGINSITWSSNRGGSGSATNSSGDWTGWSINGITLQQGENVITITATDTNNQSATDTITVTYTPSDLVQAWSANEQTGDNDWKDSSVTYCVRLLIEGAQINRSGNQIMLGFKGRSSGDYTIRKVSIAERDPNGGEGDVIDSTWTKVTFDGKDETTWNTDTITVPAGQEKLSNPISFPIQEGKDYYVTFKIDTPSVYLNPPSTYRELYFWSDDHTTDIDWSSNGHSTTQDYHALSGIYVLSSDDSTPPGDVTNVTTTPGHGQVTLSWTNPSDSDFAGVMIRYRTDGTYPSSYTDGTAIPNGNNGKIPGQPNGQGSYVHTGLDAELIYNYSIFTYDTSGNYSQTVHVSARPLPAIELTATPTSADNPHTSVTFSIQTDCDDDYFSYRIEFGDGASATGLSATHVYTQEGQYTAKAIVSDSQGHTAEKTIQIIINDNRPAVVKGLTIQ